MTLHQLGRTEEAEVERVRLRETMKEFRYWFDMESKRFVDEVQAMLGK